jgi:hypothetical protein
VENISPERAIDAFRDGLIRWDFKEELGRYKPKTVDHLMSLANEWADGEDSISAPRSRRRSAEHDGDAKDHFHNSSRKKGRQNRYDDADVTDMVASGYVNEDRDDNRDGEITTMAVAAGALAVIRSQERSGADDVISHNCQQKRCSMEGAQGTHTSIKMEFEDPLTSSSSVENSFISVERFKRECSPSNWWPVR